MLGDGEAANSIVTRIVGDSKTRQRVLRTRRRRLKDCRVEENLKLAEATCFLVVIVPRVRPLRQVGISKGM